MRESFFIGTVTTMSYYAQVPLLLLLETARQNFLGENLAAYSTSLAIAESKHDDIPNLFHLLQKRQHFYNKLCADISFKTKMKLELEGRREN